MKILTPENTVPRNSRVIGDKYIEVVADEWGITYIVYEIGEVVENTYGAHRLKSLAAWDDGFSGPAEYSELPVRYNGFIPYPTFKENNV